MHEAPRRRWARRLTTLRSERGASSIEYALIAVFIAVVVVASVTLFGGSTASLFSRTCESLPSQLTSCG